MGKRSKKLARVAGSMGAVAVVALAAPESGMAYGHTWGCTGWPAYTQCYDTTGVQYNPWVAVRAFNGNVPPEICAKAITAAGNIRTGSGCSYYSSDRVSSIAGGTPTSWAYVYWGGWSGGQVITGNAST